MLINFKLQDREGNALNSTLGPVGRPFFHRGIQRIPLTQSAVFRSCRVSSLYSHSVSPHT